VVFVYLLDVEVGFHGGGVHSFFLVGLGIVVQVQQALSQAGLESSNLIVGIDFTKSNEWTGLKLFFLFTLFDITLELAGQSSGNTLSC
jgi:hypothetical protein